MTTPSGSGTYQLVIDGELGDRFTPLFEGMILIRRDGKTHITGPVADQAQLFGLIDRVQDVGLTLISVEQVGRVADPHDDS